MFFISILGLGSILILTPNDQFIFYDSHFRGGQVLVMMVDFAGKVSGSAVENSGISKESDMAALVVQPRASSIDDQRNSVWVFRGRHCFQWLQFCPSHSI